MAVPVFWWFSSPGKPRSPWGTRCRDLAAGTAAEARPGACGTVTELGRPGLQPQLHHLCLPKQHPGLRRL